MLAHVYNGLQCNLVYLQFLENAESHILYFLISQKDLEGRVKLEFGPHLAHVPDFGRACHTVMEVTPAAFPLPKLLQIQAVRDACTSRQSCHHLSVVAHLQYKSASAL